MANRITLHFIIIISLIFASLHSPHFAHAELTAPGDNPYSASEFADVSIDSTYYDALAYLKVNGIVQGYEDDTFKPDNTINRAEFTKIIIESTYDPAEINACLPSLTSPPNSNLTIPPSPISQLFLDVPAQESTWFSKYICLAKQNNIIKGYDDGTFKPEQEINVAEAAKILIETGLTTSYYSQQSQTWYEDYLIALEMQSAIPESIKSVSDPITRGQMAEIVYRLLNQITDKDSNKATTIMI